MSAAERIRKAIAVVNAAADGAGDEEITPTEIAEAIRDCLELPEIGSIPNVRKYLGEALVLQTGSARKHQDNARRMPLGHRLDDQTGAPRQRVYAMRGDHGIAKYKRPS